MRKAFLLNGEPTWSALDDQGLLVVLPLLAFALLPPVAGFAVLAFFAALFDWFWCGDVERRFRGLFFRVSRLYLVCPVVADFASDKTPASVSTHIVSYSDEAATNARNLISELK